MCAAALFFTRWLTHFCALVFVFLAGTSAGLMGGAQDGGGAGRVPVQARRLADFHRSVRRRHPWSFAAVVIGHNLVDPIWPVTTGVFDTNHPWWVALHAQVAIPAGPFFFAMVYPVVPWTGVLLLGYGTAQIFERRPQQRDARLLAWAQR